MSMRPLNERRDGYYGEFGSWQRLKFCFRACGASCTCGPPMGRWYAAEHDQRAKQGTTSPVNGPGEHGQ